MASTLPLSAQAIKQLIGQDILTCQQLLKLLQNENAMLQSRNAEQLQQVIEQKHLLMSKLEASAKQRSLWLKGFHQEAAPSSSTEERWQQLLLQHQDAELPELWQQLQETLAHCKLQNEQNGKIISRGQKTLKQLVTLLRGQQVSPANLYTAKGMTTGGDRSHNFVKA